MAEMMYTQIVRHHSPQTPFWPSTKPSWHSAQSPVTLPHRAHLVMPQSEHVMPAQWLMQLQLKLPSLLTVQLPELLHGLGSHESEVCWLKSFNLRLTPQGGTLHPKTLANECIYRN